ncbi:MAG: cell division protein [Rhodocyclaceae bacterium]|nr:MAG: cell division protein [Rhodocyclaceae bacterium]TNC99022.1 MAG: cell division protein [Rhodocyclaceae bacterium]
MDEISNLDHAPTPEESLRRRLVNRILIAALMVVGLLGSLAMFEAIYTPPTPPVAAKLTLPPKPAPATESETKPIAPAIEAKPEPEVAKPAVKAVPERTAAPSAPRPSQVQPAPIVAAPHRAPASRPVTQAVERRYALQMGVFGNMANAEDLRAKLVANGIPATIEARVSVGPFRTRQEVDAARAKLKELGLDDGLLITTRK